MFLPVLGMCMMLVRAYFEGELEIVSLPTLLLLYKESKGEKIKKIKTCFIYKTKGEIVSLFVGLIIR